MSVEPEKMLPDLNAFERDLLRQVASLASPSGMQLKHELETRYERVLAARVYNALSDLVEAGMVEKDAVDGRTNAYRLTERGRSVLVASRDWTDAALEGSA